MGEPHASRPVPPAPSPPSARSSSASPPPSAAWPADALALARDLQRSLTIGDRQWHAFKSQRPRRGAEQIAAALVQLLAADDPARPEATAARLEAIALLEHALGWLRREISDPGCPDHGR